jgi:tRNA(His) guanylyltransferase
MSDKKDSFGDRMKFFEKIGDTRLMPTLPILARLDGKCFSKFTNDLGRPFDSNFSDIMTSLTNYLVTETVARVGYTQSDEITLLWCADNWKSEVFMGGKSSKMISILAAMASTKFNRLLSFYLPSKVNEIPIFDCRVWNVPSRVEAANALIWREKDAVRNSIQSLGQDNFSHNLLHKKSCNEIQDMLWKEKGINWNDLPDNLKRGTYIQAKKISTKFTAEELENLPEKHHARTNPDLVTERRVIGQVELPILTKIENVVDVLFDGVDPIMKEE